MAISSSSVHVVLYLSCTFCLHYALASAAPAPSSSRVSGYSVSAAHGRRDDVVNTTKAMAMNDAAVPSMDFFERLPPPLWSKANISWAAMEGFTPGTIPKHQGGVVVGNQFSVRGTSSYARRGDTRAASSASASAPPVVSNRSAMQEPPLHREELSGVHRQPGKSVAASKARKPLCSYHRTESLLHGRVECSGVVVVVVAGSALLILLCTLAGAGLLLRCAHSTRRGEIADLEDDDRQRTGPRPDLFRQAAGPRRYSYRTLATAASNFAESRRIGRGGFGSVYDGYLDELDHHVAVKMFSATGSTEQGRREFEAEVKVMSQLRHRNVVQLVGWCDGRKGLLLAYELAPGGSLENNLYDSERLLTWAERYRIALGLGAAIHYLHMECEQCVVHGDIKPSNVMLDASRNAKLGDFGLARLVDHGAEPQTTQVVAGTIGYIDPEFVGDRRRCPESDVYSFGVVLLEIACGGRPTASGQTKEAATSVLLKRVSDKYDRNAVLDAADWRLDGAFDVRQMERVLVTGLWCARRDRNRRPSIAQAMDVLRSETKELPVLLAAAAMHGGSGQIRAFEERAYGDLSSEDDVESTLSSASTVYLSPEDSGYLQTDE